MTDRELMQQALEALEEFCEHQTMLRPIEKRDALRERLAQQEQEPVAWTTGWHGGHCVIRAANPSAILPIGIALYTAPPRREWVGLTEEDFSAINQSCLTKLQAATSAESILKEKNT